MWASPPTALCVHPHGCDTRPMHRCAAKRRKRGREGGREAPGLSWRRPSLRLAAAPPPRSPGSAAHSLPTPLAPVRVRAR
eukprot:30770-Rhodomonas_salina.1